MRKDLTGHRFGRLSVLEFMGTEAGRTRWRCLCDCGEEVVVKGIYLTTGDTKSCGCLKREQEKVHLRDEYEDKRVNDVMLPLFKGREPRKDSSTGFRGVSKYKTRKSQEVRYRAWITVAGKRHYKSGFLTAEDAYYKGRLLLEATYLPKQD